MHLNPGVTSELLFAKHDGGRGEGGSQTRVNNGLDVDEGGRNSSEGKAASTPVGTLPSEGLVLRDL